MNKLILILLIAVAMSLACAAPSAQACDSLGYGYGYLYNALDYRVPYFAAHPPVYYSYPVPRTYGYSPFAYPPHVMTPEVAAAVQPLQISNPYVPADKASPAPAQDRAAKIVPVPQPLLVINPFVGEKNIVAQAGR